MSITTTGNALRQRKISEVMFRGFGILALLLVLVPAIWLIGSVVAHAAPHWKWSVLWSSLSVQDTGGLRDEILGTLILMLGVLIIAGSIGVLAGIHLSEFAKTRKNGKPSGGALRIASDVLSGFPSIVLGYVGYAALVVGLHWGYSLLSALIILSIMVIPYIAKTTESSLRQVPTAYREGAVALGMTAGYSLRKIVLKTALPGIVTGLLLAMAIASGETAPLIYTAGFSNTLPHGIVLTHAQFPYLTYAVFTFYNAPAAQAHYVAFDAALILVVLILLLLVISRVFVARTPRHTEGGAGRTPRRPPLGGGGTAAPTA